MYVQPRTRSNQAACRCSIGTYDIRCEDVFDGFADFRVDSVSATRSFIAELMVALKPTRICLNCAEHMVCYVSRQWALNFG